MKKYKKRTDYFIGYEVVEPGTKVHNHLEKVDYVTDETRCVVLTGTRSESWPVTISKLIKSYDFIDPEMSTEKLVIGSRGGVRPKPDNNTILAESVYTPCEVETSWGDKLHANIGDYIAYACNKDGSPNNNDRWVINGGVFIDTYEYAE